jgi:hypothetical protein
MRLVVPSILHENILLQTLTFMETENGPTIYVRASNISGRQDTAVGVATGYVLDDRGVGVQVPAGSRIFSTSSRPVLGPTQPPIQWVLGPLYPGVMRPGRQADHSPPTSAEVKKCGSIHPLPPTPSWRSA